MINKIILTLIFLWLGWHLAMPSDLASNDLGRHLKNGELILKGTWDVLYTNYYSLLLPNYPFINHHWFFGVLVFIVWSYVGFAGLSVVYIAIEILSFKIFVSRRKVQIPLLMLAGLMLMSIPLMSVRPEIRPEGLSMLFCALFWYLGDLYLAKRLKVERFTLILFLLQIVWVNTHIFFTMGPILIMIFWLHARINDQPKEATLFAKTYFILLLACLINPSGIKGALLPFHIGDNLGYSILEEQSIFFMWPRYPDFNIFGYFIFTVIVAWVGYGLLIKREGFKKHAFMIILMFIVTIIAMRVVRFIGPYGYFWVPLTAYAWWPTIKALSEPWKKVVLILLVVVGLSASLFVNFDIKRPPVFGLVPNVGAAADFFKKEKLSGPIFNNYEVGGYLIYYLQGQAPVFVDNRVEAFPHDFFKQMLIPMQSNDYFWEFMLKEYGFKTIFFNRADQTPWARGFIQRRLRDSKWAPVFVDETLIIFVKRTPENADLIRRCEFTPTQTKS